MTKKDKQRFLKRIVLLSIGVGLLLTATCIKSWWTTNTIDGYSLTALLSFWGGELLVSCLIKLFGDRPHATTSTKIQNNQKENNTI